MTALRGTPYDRLAHPASLEETQARAKERARRFADPASAASAALRADVNRLEREVRLLAQRIDAALSNVTSVLTLQQSSLDDLYDRLVVTAGGAGDLDACPARREVAQPPPDATPPAETQAGGGFIWNDHWTRPARRTTKT